MRYIIVTYDVDNMSHLWVQIWARANIQTKIFFSFSVNNASKTFNALPFLLQQFIKKLHNSDLAVEEIIEIKLGRRKVLGKKAEKESI